MRVSGEATFKEARHGANPKTGDNWRRIKLLDEDADEIIKCYVDEQIYQCFEGLEKNTPVIVTMDIVPGQKYFNIVQVEVIDK